MWSGKYWSTRPLTELSQTDPGSLKNRLDRLFARWLKRRGPVTPPFRLNYRQIFILPTGFGCLLGAIAFAMLISSLNFNNNMGLFTTFLVAGIAVLSMHIAYRNLEGITIRQCTAEPVFAGQDLALLVRLSEDSNRLRSGLRLSSQDDARTDVIRLKPADHDQMMLTLPTVERGWFKPGRLTLATRHPLGLFRAWSVFWPEQQFLVWPKPADQAPALPLSNRLNSGEKPGDEGDEYHGLRSWREGDPIHRIAWKASQRHQDLLAREFTQPVQDELLFSIDQTGVRERERAISIVTSWVLESDQRGLQYGLELGAVRVDTGSGRRHRDRCLNALAELP